MGINFPIRNMAKNILISPAQKLEKTILDLINEIKFKVEHRNTVINFKS